MHNPIPAKSSTTGPRLPLKVYCGSLIFIVTLAWGLLSCGVDPDSKPGLYYLDKSPYVLSVSDTSDILLFKKVYVTGAQGKLQTLNEYTKVKLTSDDTSLVKVTGLRLIGVKKTAEVTITATETVDNDFSTQFKVKVVDSL